MMIFDSFANAADAERFAVAITSEFGREAHVYEDIGEAQAADPFPFALFAPVVHIERTEDYEPEAAIEERVAEFGGRFAGT